MADTGPNPRRRSLSLLLSVGLGSSLALAGTSHAAAPESGTASASVCGGLTTDAHFAQERTLLGASHACEHLRAREQSEAHGSPPGRFGSPVRPQAVAAAERAGRRPAVVGRWSTARNPGAEAIGVTAVLLHTGQVLLFGRVRPSRATTVASVFNPVTGTARAVPAPAPIFCSSVTPLADGRILTVGGADPFPRGIQDVWLFDPVTRTWAQQPDTPRGRYYPTSTRLPDGRVVVTAGTESDGSTRNPVVEVYTPPAAGGTTGRLSAVGPEHPTAFYPHQLVMRDGRMLQVDQDSTYRLDPATWTWTRLPSLPVRARGAAAHLMLPGGPQGSTQVMMIGGLEQGPRTLPVTQRFDYARPAAGWQPAARMPRGRAHMNVVQVPDGSAYVVGGNASGLRGSPTRRTLHYDPRRDRWTVLAAQVPRRAYHSTALLLPDGRIMSAGDDFAGGGRQLIDIYSPPYLFQGQRPRIVAAPRHVGFRQRFRIRTAGRRVTRAVLMAPGATTHANEMNARHVRLAVRRTPTGLRATAPTANVAPPGHYMLFVLRPDGVPSVARWVRVGR